MREWRNGASSGLEGGLVGVTGCIVRGGGTAGALLASGVEYGFTPMGGWYAKESFNRLILDSTDGDG